jgi:hypothetical protein
MGILGSRPNIRWNGGDSLWVTIHFDLRNVRKQIKLDLNVGKIIFLSFLLKTIK